MHVRGSSVVASTSYLELCCQGIAGSLEGSGIQAFLVPLQSVTVLCLLHCFIHKLENLSALVPGTAELLVLRCATYQIEGCVVVGASVMQGARSLV